MLFVVCAVLGLDIQDEMGRHEVGFEGDIVKFPVNENGMHTHTATLRGGHLPPPPSPEDGCRMEAQFFIKKVPGNFHLSTHSSRVQPEQVDMRHIIHRLEFGEDSLAGSHLKGSFDPLRDIDKTEVPCMKVWRGVGWGGDCMHASHAAPSPPTTQLTTPTITT